VTKRRNAPRQISERHLLKKAFRKYAKTVEFLLVEVRQDPYMATRGKEMGNYFKSVNVRNWRY
jgi:hypothetical protein